MNTNSFSRRDFIRRGGALAAGAPLGMPFAPGRLFGAEAATRSDKPTLSTRSDARVAIVPCRAYGTEVHAALKQSFDLIGGIDSLVKNKTVTVKLNLTGTNFTPFLGRPVGETFMTHYSTALALASLLFAAGAKRVRFVESTQNKADLESSLGYADWDVKAL